MIDYDMIEMVGCHLTYLYRVENLSTEEIVSDRTETVFVSPDDSPFGIVDDAAEMVAADGYRIISQGALFFHAQKRVGDQLLIIDCDCTARY